MVLSRLSYERVRISHVQLFTLYECLLAYYLLIKVLACFKMIGFLFVAEQQ